MPTTLHENRPSAGIGVVEVQKPWVFAISKVPARRGSAWSRCKNPWFFAISKVPARPSAGIGVVEVQKLEVFCDFRGARATLCGDRRGRGAKTLVFLRFLRCPRNPLRGLAWSRCKLEVFCDFYGARATLLRESAWSRCKNSRFLRLLLFELVLGSCLVVRAPAPGTGGSRVRFLPGPRASQDATCILKQLAQSNLRRASCSEQLAQTNLHRPVCAERLA